MSVTVNDILLDVSYRRGENGVPSGNEQTRRISFVSQAFRDLMRENKYWFHVTEYATQTEGDEEIYSLPTDYREFLEVRTDGLLRVPQSEDTAFNVTRYPPMHFPFSTNYINNKYFYIFNDELHLLPTPGSAPSAVSVTSITVSGTTATVAATDHGFSNNDYVQIAGASVSECNGSKRITLVDDDSFTYTVATGTSSPTGTITATENNLIIKYFYWADADFTSLTDEVDIPSRYKDALSAYVYGRLGQLDGERGDASDGVEEYNSIIEELNKENFRRNLVRTPLSDSMW
ncbi:hypothetical protein KO465_07515 [Candidatus Micrarchaeota archaeon]|jgi:hypothetical protein|nr:hypothetical protein [Candidatus Micrarchaeota archaeon]